MRNPNEDRIYDSVRREAKAIEDGGFMYPDNMHRAYSHYFNLILTSSKLDIEIKQDDLVRATQWLDLQIHEWSLQTK